MTEFELLRKKSALSAEELVTLAKKIRPVMSAEPNEDLHLPIGHCPHGRKFWVDTIDCGIATQSYTVLPKPRMTADKLEFLTEITIYVNSTNWSRLEPRVWDVMTQIPEELRDKATAFELYAPFANLYNFDLKCFVVKCILYSGPMLPEIEHLPVKW